MSDRLKMYTALADEDLRRRVQGAAVMHAHALVGDPDATDQDKALARTVLGSPFSQVEALVIEVASDRDVLGAVAMSRDGRAMLSTNVTDEQISRVVSAAWTRVAAEKMEAQS